MQVAEIHGNAWRVTSGLAAGDRLIVQGNGKVKPGQIVSAVELADQATPASEGQTAGQTEKAAAAARLAGGTRVAQNP